MKTNTPSIRASDDAGNPLHAPSLLQLHHELSPRWERAKLSATARETIVRLALTGKYSQSQLANRFGVSRERVRQILHADGAFRRWRELRDWLPIETEFIARAKQAKPCVLCGCWVLRKGTLTCSEGCAADWPIIRYHLDPDYREKHRILAARWTAAHPDKVDLGTLRFAQRILAGEQGSARKGWVQPSSKAAEINVRRNLGLPVAGEGLPP